MDGVLAQEYDLTPTEVRKLQLDQGTRQLRKVLHLSWITIDLNFSIILSDFVKTLDPLRSTLLSKPIVHPVSRSPPGPPLPCVSTHFSCGLFAGALLQTPFTEDNASLDPFSLLNQKSDDIPVVLDTGALTSLTPVLSNFIGPLTQAPIDEIRGLTATTRVVGRGIVQWKICDYCNVTGVVQTLAYYVPECLRPPFQSAILFSGTWSFWQMHCSRPENDSQTS
jgi:hypothetical protein